MLWKSRDPCDAQNCQVAYNAAPLRLLVWREGNCCDQPGFSIEFNVDAEGCEARSYYLIFSKDLAWTQSGERRAFLDRHINSMASAIASACGLAEPATIPAPPLDGLFD